ncbi:MAG: hypothetical protein R2713_17260 [Ilumatobacteraceae bacterium]
MRLRSTAPSASSGSGCRRRRRSSTVRTRGRRRAALRSHTMPVTTTTTNGNSCAAGDATHRAAGSWPASASTPDATLDPTTIATGTQSTPHCTQATIDAVAATNTATASHQLCSCNPRPGTSTFCTT